MKAIIYSKYGGPEVLRLEETEKPSPKDDEVLIRNYAVSLNDWDFGLMQGDFVNRILNGLRKPKRKILGSDIAGRIEAVGKNVTRFKIGDQVYGTSFKKFGAYAEYICLPENAMISPKPATLSYNEAAVIPFGGSTALHFLRTAKVQAGQKVLIYGASGAVGTSAVQLAKYFGAEVTAVCSTANAELVRSLGADQVIDYTKEDFSKSGITYDIVFDAVGKSPFSA